jgi:two-component system sensor histidine kinase BaeS
MANALRHTPAGGVITLRGRVDTGGVIFEVSDTGAGIAANELPYIFDRFWSRGAQETGGSGLGLAIARSIVAVHDGTIEAESKPGQGTTLRVWLPTARSAPAAGREGGAGPMPSKAF